MCYLGAIKEEKGDFMENMKKVKEEILAALNHQEAEEGLYFRNFFNMHEADERQGVHADEKNIIVALNDLIKDGKVKLDSFDGDVIFLANK